MFSQSRSSTKKPAFSFGGIFRNPKMASRKMHRKQRKMQRKAMQEAQANGWRQYTGEEESSGDEDETKMLSLVETAPPMGEDTVHVDDVAQFTPKACEKKEPEADPNISRTGQLDVAVKSFRSLVVFSPNYFENETPQQTKSSPPASSDDDDDIDEIDDPPENDNAQGTAIENTAELHALLNDLQLNSAQKLTHPAMAVDSPPKFQFSKFTPKAVQDEEPTETETTIEDETQRDEDSSSMRKESVKETSLNGDSDDNEQSSDDEDDDSVDFGVSTSMWPKQDKNEYTGNMMAAAENAANISTSFFAMNGNDALRNAAQETDVEETLSDGMNDNEEPEEGNEVFLLTQEARYTGKEGQNDLFKIQDAGIQEYQTFEPADDSSNVYNKLLSGSLSNTFAVCEKKTEQNNTEGLEFFPPRYEDGDKGMWENLKIVSTVDGSPDDATPKNASFGPVQMVSPQVCAMSTSTPKPDNAPLSAMVHPMNLDLFESSTFDTPARQKSDLSTVSSCSGSYLGSLASCPVDRSGAGMLNSEHCKIVESTQSESRRSNLSSSFRSSTKSNRVVYNLSGGRKSMSKTERVNSKTFLPGKPLFSPGESPSTPLRSIDRSLSVLLVEMTQQLFEVVSVDVHKETTVGDVLAKARSVATDAALSEQKYISICYGTQEFGAPMLPVNVVIDWNKHKTRPLVIAVPTGSTASAMQAVKRVLWKNPKTRRWWRQQDPFSPRAKKKKAEDTLEPATPKKRNTSSRSQRSRTD